MIPIGCLQSYLCQLLAKLLLELTQINAYTLIHLTNQTTFTLINLFTPIAADSPALLLDVMNVFEFLMVSKPLTRYPCHKT